MPKRPSILFFCKQCGHETPRWEGKCPACHEWDTLVEAPSESAKSSKRSKNSLGNGGGGNGPTRLALVTNSQPKPLREHAREKLPRIPVPLTEFHRVLGGGIVPGGSVLIGGEPGIGKSTLMLQLLATLASVSPVSDDGKHGFLYITGEEAPSQIAARGLRLAESELSGSGDFGELSRAVPPGPTVRGTRSTTTSKGIADPSDSDRAGCPDHKFRKGYDSDNLKLASETGLATILEMLDAERPRVAVIDSVQTLRDDALNSAPGSVSQVRECAMALVDAARQLNVAIFLIGHVTKDGTIAGPRVLEHIVDTVLNFEGEPRLDLRVLRASKNRFGSTDEAGFFEMTPTGLSEVPDPSAALLDRDSAADKGAGSAIGALSEGTRVLLVELQGLTVPVPGGGSPRRKASGVDANRLAQILAVLEAKAGVPFGALDVFASAAGGFRIEEPAADLPLALALASVASGRPVRERLVAAGEVGLGGEIRPIARVEARIAEARRLGFTSVLLPARGRSSLPPQMNGVKILRARTLKEALLLGLC